ncbi:MAG TPA: A/G-specific adenine glycosylase [Terriglobia bacterium]
MTQHTAPVARVPADPRLGRVLVRWFQKHRRPLPWRETRDPYAVWVSEVMLQQTQVGTVIPYYKRFLLAFPRIESLARAPLERVLQVWSGLGYYRRVRHLHAAAGKIVAEFGGRFPATFAEARSLPGVGGYTAAAVLSIAYGVPLAVVDGNVARVMARLDARRGSLSESRFRQAIENGLARLLPRRDPGDFNQALMELGQTICLPRAPRCPACPMKTWCRARQMGKPESFPSPRPRRPTEEHHLAVALVFVPGGQGLRRRTQAAARRAAKPGSRSVLMVRGLDGGLMRDLWNFPAAFGASPAKARDRLKVRLDSLVPGLDAARVRMSPASARLVHGVTYRKIRVRVYPCAVGPCEIGALLRGAEDGEVRWLELSRLGRAAVSELARKIARAVMPNV